MMSTSTQRLVDEAWIMIVTVAITTVVWLVVTFATKPESQDTLVSFYRRTAPSLTGWRPIAALAPDVHPRQEPQMDRLLGDGERPRNDGLAGDDGDE